jgi:hypothetical protein
LLRQQRPNIATEIMTQYDKAKRAHQSRMKSSGHGASAPWPTLPNDGGFQLPLNEL